VVPQDSPVGAGKWFPNFPCPVTVPTMLRDSRSNDGVATAVSPTPSEHFLAFDLNSISFPEVVEDLTRLSWWDIIFVFVPVALRVHGR